MTDLNALVLANAKRWANAKLTHEAAHRAYVAKAAELHGEFARAA